MLELLLKLILCHVLGDFVFQPDSWIQNRKEKVLKSKYLYFHIFLHSILIGVFLFKFIGTLWLGLFIIIFSHFWIDVFKIILEKRNYISQFSLFIVDQLLHLFVIVCMVNFYYPFIFTIESFFTNKLIVLILISVACIFIAPILMRLFFIRWYEIHLLTQEEKITSESLKNAGRIIGILERIFIILFININFYEGIGYLLAAKSIFRFGDLTNSKDKKMTEYILIGTLLSFLIGIVLGFILKYGLIMCEI